MAALATQESLKNLRRFKGGESCVRGVCACVWAGCCARLRQVVTLHYSVVRHTTSSQAKGSKVRCESSYHIALQRCRALHPRRRLLSQGFRSRACVLACCPIPSSIALPCVRACLLPDSEQHCAILANSLSKEIMSLGYERYNRQGVPDFDDFDERDDRFASGADAGDSANAVPDVVKTFVAYLYRHVRERNVLEIHQMYETSFNKLSARFFAESPWPSVDAIAPVVDGDHVFCLLYKEMYYRHIYARLQPTLQQRCDSWENYCNLFQVSSCAYYSRCTCMLKRRQFA